MSLLTVAYRLKATVSRLGVLFAFAGPGRAMPRNGRVTKLTGRLNVEGNVKDTKKKIHWVLSSDSL